MNEFLTKIFRILHISVFFILVYGAFIPSKYLIYYLFLLPMLVLHWIFNNNSCMVTDIEFVVNSNHYNNENEMIYYLNMELFNILKKINIKFDNFDSFHSFLYYTWGILWIFAFIRALIYYRKDIAKNWSIVSKHFISRFICDPCK